MNIIEPPVTNRLKIEYRSIDSLVPYANNARVHSKAQIRTLVASLKALGWTNPILIGAKRDVLCGHGRLEAAKLLRMTTVPTIMLEHLSDADCRAYILADNAIASKSGWSKEMLASELRGLVDIGYEVELTGFDTLEIDTLLSFDGEPLATDEDVVELPSRAPPISSIGDHWIIGRHHLVCGDARSPGIYDTLLGGELAQMTFTDPPYNVRIAGNVSGLGKHKHGEFVMGSGEMSDAEFSLKLLRPALRCIARYSEAGAIAFVCMDWRGGPQLLDAAEGVFAEVKNLICWVKSSPGMGAFYRSQHEFIYVFKVSRGHHINNFALGGGGRHRSNVWPYPGATTNYRGREVDLADHPTIKPKRMVADAILDCSKTGGIILDPFAGSGTSLVAAEMTGRRGYGIELDTKFVDVILRRVQAETGKVATLDGVPFQDVAAARSIGRESPEIVR